MSGIIVALIALGAALLAALAVHLTGGGVSNRRSRTTLTIVVGFVVFVAVVSFLPT
ncbi:hypothetical protein [Devosia nitrariae]|uniref:Uncharacterized protein n=1 Tax=Devosia nitrariae TaxID=2071872 RepID=A0ABQ5W7Z8_9HYPH|nr:hypothetical protein [Devosia nitrariae]GLQ55904.1 hypothetical protein GCM10010862_31630 [Devosia nitrariae]